MPEFHGGDYYYHLFLTMQERDGGFTWRSQHRHGIFCGQQRSASSEHADEAQRATQQLRAINQFGDNIYAPIAPSTAQVNLQLNEECAGLYAYNQELYLNPELVNAISDQLTRRWRCRQ